MVFVCVLRSLRVVDRGDLPTSLPSVFGFSSDFSGNLKTVREAAKIKQPPSLNGITVVLVGRVYWSIAKIS